jgi:putative SOS response-associated peptidase YedK
MCGRYYIEVDDKTLGEIIEAVKRSPEDTLTLKTSGEVFPTNVVPVIIGSRQYRAMKWGFTASDGKPVINARSETALTKPLFAASMRERRCLIPASGYFEWKREGKTKTKFYFHSDSGALYLAGCWRSEPGSAAFVILTRDAVNGCETVHDRMPVIIPRNLANEWLNGNIAVMQRSVTELIFEESDNVQQRLFD